MKNSFSIVDFLLSRPYFIISFLALFLFLGLVGYNKIDRKLFPDSNYPTVAVVIVEPGESAKGLAANVSIPVEEELYTLDKIRRVYSTTIDEVGVISAEFEYIKGIDSATSDLANALDKIKAKLPASILNPQIIKITAATAPIVTYAVSAKEGNISLEDIRQIAQTKLKHRLIKLQGVANVDIFGGYEKEIEVIVDKEKLEKYNLNIALVVAKLRANDDDFAIGFTTGKDKRYLLRAQGKRKSIAELKRLSTTKDIELQDIAKVYFGHYDNSAEHYGNSKNAIAIAIQRAGNTDVIQTIERVEKEITKLKNEYENLTFVVTDTQKDTIVQSTNNMFESLLDAIIMSTLVVFFFLASFRQVLVVLVTIPLVYATTTALMWIFGIEFNVVTLTAIILALGLLLDDAVVVMENIERQLSTMLFVGGYPQTIFQPLAATLLLALAASYAISITAVPLLSLKILTIKHPFVLKSEAFFEKITGGFSSAIADFFVSAVSLGAKKKSVALAYTAVLLFLFFTSVKGVMPTVGQEVMPPMDTGGVRICITVDPNLPIEASKKFVQEANKIITRQGDLLYLSSAIGSEAEVMSIGSGSGIDHIAISATYVDRYKRKETIWQIERKLRKELNKIKNVNSVDVVDYGATAIASLRANIDVTLYSDDLTKLQKAEDIVADAMHKTGGVVSVSRTWLGDKRVYEFSIDEKKSAYYGLNNQDIAKQLQLFVRGAKSASFYLQNSSDFGTRVWVDEQKRDTIEDIENYLLSTKKGESSFA